MFNKEKFISEIQTQGYSIVRNALSPELIAELKEKLISAIEKEVAYHKTKNYTDYGMVLLCSIYDRVFSEILDLPSIYEPLESILGDG